MKPLQSFSGIFLLMVFAGVFASCSKSSPVMEEVKASANHKTNPVNFMVSISQALTPAGVYAGEFTATGGFADGSGTTEEYVFATFPPPPPAPSSTGFSYATYTFNGEQTFTYNDGSGTIKCTISGKWWWTDPANAEAHASGTWVVIGGTGAYANIKGKGTLEADLVLVPGAETTADIWEGYLWYPSSN